MAKGNMLLGYSRGAVGDVVFTRSKGQQIARARNRNPKNPKTKAQMSQRIKFASVVEFFRRGNQNLFQFAFENKGVKQSDYNAFVSANADKGIYLTPAQLKDQNFPIVAPFIMTQGSLSRDIRYDEDYYPFGGVPFSGESAPTTVAALSTALIAAGFSAGDIVTIVNIDTDLSVSGEKPYEPTTNILWIIKQFIVDESNTATLASIGVSATKITDESIVTLKCEAFGSQGMGCIIVSRNEPDGLKVTNTVLGLSAGAVQANAAALASAWVEEDIDIWGASEEAILQGSLS